MISEPFFLLKKFQDIFIIVKIFIYHNHIDNLIYLFALFIIEMNLKAYAKINLTLDILRRLPNGYHEINSVMQQVELHDDILLKQSNKIIVDCKEIPCKKNLVYKTAILLKNKFNIKKGVEIKIKKNIPISSGLSGGSSDAASALIGLNKLWNLNLDNDKLIEIAASIGMDVPFHIVANACEARGRGEILKKINPVNLDIILINPNLRISTKEAYKNLDLSKIGKKLKTKDLLKAIEEQNIIKIANNLHNDFEPTILKKYPIINKIKQKLIKNGALNALMSGSGPTIFGIFENEEKAKKAYHKLKHFKFICMTKTR